MLVALPAPVLSVTADTVRELEGSEALSVLWPREFLSRLSFFDSSMQMQIASAQTSSLSSPVAPPSTSAIPLSNVSG